MSLLFDKIKGELNHTVSPIKKAVLNTARNYDVARGKYVWTPDNMQWGGAGNKATAATVPGEVYQPHFFSGQDVFVFLINRMGQMFALPVTGFGYGVSQQKTPVYGAWSYNYDAVLKGNRIVQGEFSIVFTKPNFLMNLLGDPSEPDHGDQGAHPIVAVHRRDEIQRRDNLKSELWNVNGDGMKAIYSPGEIRGERTSAYPFGRKAPKGASPADYAGHPTFDLLIVHGNDPNKVSSNYSDWNAHEWAHSVGDHFKLMSSDYNDVSGSNFEASERIYIENVELMSSGIQYDMTGQPMQESYSFVARDVTTPTPVSSKKQEYDIKAGVGEIAGNLAEVFGQNYTNAVKKFGQPYIDLAKKLGAPYVNAITMYGEAYFNFVNQFGNGVIDGVAKYADNYLDGLETFGDAYVSGVDKFGDAFVSGVSLFGPPYLKGIAEYQHDYANGVAQFGDWYVDGVVQYGRTFVDGVLQFGRDYNPEG